MACLTAYCAQNFPDSGKSMSLLDEIIELASDDKESIGNLLRKCLILEQQVKNEKFRAWLNKELDGYDQDAELPSYRTFNCINKGVFFGFAGRVLHDQPLSLHVLDDKDRKIVERCTLLQPAASYDGRPEKAGDAALPWNPYLTVKYQTKFFSDSDLVLNRAWQEIPGSILVGLTEQIRTRVLRFALELKNNLPMETASAKQIAPAIVERSVVTNIYGGNILIAAHAEQISQVINQDVTVGDFSSLSKALGEIGVTEEGLRQLSNVLEADKSSGRPTLGEKTKTWVADIGKYLGKQGVKVGVEVAKQVATKWIMQHTGLGV
jgi:hypothetical protein